MTAVDVNDMLTVANNSLAAFARQLNMDSTDNWLQRLLSIFAGSISELGRSIGIDKSQFSRAAAGARPFPAGLRSHLFASALARKGELNDGIAALPAITPGRYKDSYHHGQVRVEARGTALLLLYYFVLSSNSDVDTSDYIANGATKLSIDLYLAEAFQSVFSFSSDEVTHFIEEEGDFKRVYQFQCWEYGLPLAQDIRKSRLYELVRSEARLVFRRVPRMSRNVDFNMNGRVLTLEAIEFKIRWEKEARKQIDAWRNLNQEERALAENLNVTLDAMKGSPDDFDIIARTIVCIHWILFGEFKWQD